MGNNSQSPRKGIRMKEARIMMVEKKETEGREPLQGQRRKNYGEKVNAEWTFLEKEVTLKKGDLEQRP